MVELALAIPILLIVVFGIVDFGRAVNYWNDENHLANLGARYAATGNLPGYGACSSSTTLVSYLTCEAGQDSVELENGNTVGTSGVQAPGVSGGICVNVPNNNPGQPVQVKVSATYKWLPLPKVLGGGFSFADSTLNGTATMRLEAPIPSTWITSTSTSGCP
jgi:Flp pilus assembly protein TadG